MRESGDRINRRVMITRTAGTAAFAAMAGRFRPLLAASDKRWFKIGACDWNLGRMDPGAFDVAKQIGLDGVQVSLGTEANGMHLRKPEVQTAYREAMKKTGLEIGSIALGETNRVPLKRDPKAAQWLADSIDVCRQMGVTVVMPACFGAGELDMSKTQEIDHLVKVLKDCAAKAQKQGITIGLESYLSAEDNMKIIDRVGSPALKVYYDVGNSTDKGRDVYQEIRKLGKLICEFHAKDAGHMLGQGRIDFKKVRAAIDDIGYNGWFQIEAAAPHGLIADYRAHYKHLRTCFPEKG
jgi:L-ribulose-5-phosphate 3-epimerase